MMALRRSVITGKDLLLMAGKDMHTVSRRCISHIGSRSIALGQPCLTGQKNFTGVYNLKSDSNWHGKECLMCVQFSSTAKREPTVTTDIRSSIQDHFDVSGVVKTKKFVVTAEELAAMLDKGPDGVKLIDVREPKEIEETGLLPRAVNIPLTSLKAVLQLDAEMFEAQYGLKKPTKDDPIPLVFYGRSAVKSSTALEIAYKLGLKKSRHYPGGWEEWSTRQSTGAV